MFYFCIKSSKPFHGLWFSKYLHCHELEPLMGADLQIEGITPITAQKD